jgi:RimJ/RimL family protein N-acetyltransferase
MALLLQPFGPDLTRRIADGEHQDEIGPDRLTSTVREVAVALHRLYRQTGADGPWIAYLARETAGDDAPFVGTCSFKSRPRDGRVEIAYFTFPGHEGRGIGRRLAAALVEIARREPEAVEILAHTLPEVNASTRILEGLGFRHLGTVDDPDDGPVWRWTRRLAEAP